LSICTPTDIWISQNGAPDFQNCHFVTKREDILAPSEEFYAPRLRNFAGFPEVIHDVLISTIRYDNEN
jgi:hypothetical protein